MAAFVLAMTRAESAHLQAFTAFILSKPKLLMALREKRWDDFAAGYNGPNYSDNDYDTKLDEAYQRLVKASQPATRSSTPGAPFAPPGTAAAPGAAPGGLP